ncbi:hypothetical protein CSKR_113118 [Clonorchis sinensis]|uniref:Uncharacterized protein n=1 Tax=Clonorchis sinensis TaxID=79923 RepID=A0A3R7CHJ3_CLOSI|nr:hypothetical protein CSKR_113118 [Clonorchis sinensis]
MTSTGIVHAPDSSGLILAGSQRGADTSKRVNKIRERSVNREEPAPPHSKHKLTPIGVQSFPKCFVWRLYCSQDVMQFTDNFMSEWQTPSSSLRSNTRPSLVTVDDGRFALWQTPTKQLQTIGQESKRLICTLFLKTEHPHASSSTFLGIH